MELKDRSLLAELMETKKISARALAKAAGWRSHSYMNRLLNGQARTLEVEPAARIAAKLDVPFTLLFRTRTSDDAKPYVRKKVS